MKRLLLLKTPINYPALGGDCRLLEDLASRRPFFGFLCVSDDAGSDEIGKNELGLLVAAGDGTAEITDETLGNILLELEIINGCRS